MALVRNDHMLALSVVDSDLSTEFRYKGCQTICWLFDDIFLHGKNQHTHVLYLQFCSK